MNTRVLGSVAVVGIIAVSASACSGAGKKADEVAGCTGTIAGPSGPGATNSATSTMSPKLLASVNPRGEPTAAVTNLVAAPHLAAKAQGSPVVGSEHAGQNEAAWHTGRNVTAWTAAHDTRTFNGAAPGSIPVLRLTEDSRFWRLTLNDDGTADWVVDWYYERPGGKRHYEDKGFAVDDAKRDAVCKAIASLPDDSDELVTDSFIYSWDFNFGKGETLDVTNSGAIRQVDRAIAELIGDDRWKAE